MQQAMNNLDNLDNKDETSSWSGKSQIERGISGLKDTLADTDFRGMAGDISGRVRDFSGPAFRESIGFIQRHPVSSAIGLGVIGFFLGSMFSRSSTRM